MSLPPSADDVFAGSTFEGLLETNVGDDVVWPGCCCVVVIVVVVPPPASAEAAAADAVVAVVGVADVGFLNLVKGWASHKAFLLPSFHLEINQDLVLNIFQKYH